jgi:ATP-dependent protease ClpP protease subunit
MTKRNLPAIAALAKPGVESRISEQVQSRWNPDIRAATDDADTSERSISVLDPIGESFFYEGVTAKRIGAALRAIGERDVIVNINSPGGDFFEGLAIYNLLREHKGKVTVQILGLAASAASVIAMAGDEVMIGRAAFLMIHNTWICACGDRHALREASDWLEPFDEAAVSLYAARTGMDAKSLAAMCDRETWIGGDKAVEDGFADGLLSSDTIAPGTQNSNGKSPLAAEKRLDLALASGLKMSRTERRELVAALKGGKPGAAPTSMPGAAEIEAFATGAIAKLNTL